MGGWFIRLGPSITKVSDAVYKNEIIYGCRRIHGVLVFSKDNLLTKIPQRGSQLVHSPHLMVRATNEQRVPTLVATSGSHWLK